MTNNLRWVPSLYLMQGLTFAFIMNVTPILYKSFKITNGKIGLYTSLYLIPWLLKPLFAPLLEMGANKKRLIVMWQILLVMWVTLLAWSLQTKAHLLLSSLLFLMMAFCASAYDVTSDGLYLAKLSQQNQARFVGIRTVFYHLGGLLSQGILLILVGYFAAHSSLVLAWKYTFILIALSIFILAIYHSKILPDYQSLTSTQGHPLHNFKNVWNDLVQKPQLLKTMIFVFIFNFPYIQLSKIVPLFLMDKVALGGLNLGIKWVGIIYGTIGTTSLMIGVLCSGFLLSKLPLKRVFLPLTLCFAISTMSYLFLSVWPLHSLALVMLSVIFTQFCFGLSNGAYMVYLLQNFSQGRHAMSLYAIGTTLMVLGMIVAGSLSGYMQTQLGYSGLFFWVLLFNFFITLFLKYEILPLVN